MAIKKDKTRVIATIPQELKDKLDKMCEYDKRNISQELEYILESYINNHYNLYPNLVEDLPY